MKTLGFFILIATLPFCFSYLKKNNKDFRKGVALYNAESEVSSGIYTGKIRDVYDPLDQAYKLTDWLKEKANSQARQIPSGEFGEFPVLSLWIDPQDLYSEERGIYANPHKKGRLWERPGFLTFSKDSESLFSGYVGVRVHGGGSRRSKGLGNKSFRIYIRKKKYGSPAFPKKLGFTLTQKSKVERFVVRRDGNRFFSDQITSFLINELGGIAINPLKVAFLINGKLVGYHNIFDHLSEEQLKYFIGHKDFTFAKLRGDKSIEARLLYIKLRSMMEFQSNLNFNVVNDEFDLDSLMANFLIVIYSGSTDWAQGLYVKDQRNKLKWKYISWDLDGAFFPYKNETDRPGMKYVYEMQSVSMGMNMRKGNIRWSVFNRLIQEDKKFRAYFSSLINKLFDEVLVSEKFKKLMANIERDAQTVEPFNSVKEDVRILNEFITHRKSVFCDDLLEFVNLVPRTCKISTDQNHKH